jgi:hypothetical protein
MNNWNISGQILKHGIKGNQYPKLWIQVELYSPKELTLPNNRFFINFDIDTNSQSKKGRAAEFIKSKLENNKFFFLREAMVAPIKVSEKDKDGNWLNKEVTGVKANIMNLNLFSDRQDNINIGILYGKIVTYAYNAEQNMSKIILEERYRNIQTNEFKSRQIPVMMIGELSGNPVDTYCFVSAMLCGTTPSGESKVYGFAKNIIRT